MRSLMIAVSLSLAAGFAPASEAAEARPNSQASAGESTTTADFALLIVNQFRAEHGLRALVVDPRLTDIASSRAAGCASDGICTHGLVQPLTERMKAVGYPPSYGGELVADHSESIRDAFNRWCDDPTSAGILLEPHAARLGFAEYTEGDRSFFVVDIAGETGAGWSWKPANQPSS